MEPTPQHRHFREVSGDLAWHIERDVQVRPDAARFRRLPVAPPEDQLGALGLALNAVVWWNSLYIDAAGLRAFHDGGSPA